MLRRLPTKIELTLQDIEEFQQLKKEINIKIENNTINKDRMKLSLEERIGITQEKIKKI
jgi:stage III sporulation protein SpoIIIAA